MALYYKMRQILLQNATAILLQNATEVYYKMRQVFYYKIRQFYYKMRQLLQIATTSLQNATFITNCDSTVNTDQLKCLHQTRKFIKVFVHVVRVISVKLLEMLRYVGMSIIIQ